MCFAHVKILSAQHTQNPVAAPDDYISKLIFSDSFGGLHTTLGSYHYSKSLADGRNRFSNSKTLEMTYHMCLSPKNYLEAIYETAFEPLFELKKCAIRKKQKQLLLGII